MSKPVNFLDLLLGAGYGIFGTVLVLQFLGLADPAVFMVGSSIWLATILFQLYRQHRIATEQREAQKVENANG